MCSQRRVFSTGQRCTASSRTIVIEKIYADFSAAFIARTRDLRVGNALAASTQIGPVVDQRQLDKNLSYIDIGQAEGGQLLVGGQRLAGAGFFFSPAIIENHDAQARLNQDEVFGPVSTLIKVKDFEQAGMVMFNTPTVGVDYHVPFGGSKASSFGPREQGGMAMEFYTRVKTHYLA